MNVFLLDKTNNHSGFSGHPRMNRILPESSAIFAVAGICRDTADHITGVNIFDIFILLVMSTKTAKSALADRIGKARELVVAPKDTSTIKDLTIPISWKAVVQGKNKEGGTKVTQIYVLPEPENLSDKQLVGLQQYLSDCESQKFNPVNKEGEVTYRTTTIPAKGANTIKRAQTGFWYIDETRPLMLGQLRAANPWMSEEQIEEELESYIPTDTTDIKLDQLGQ